MESLVIFRGRNFLRGVGCSDPDIFFYLLYDVTVRVRTDRCVIILKCGDLVHLSYLKVQKKKKKIRGAVYMCVCKCCVCEISRNTLFLVKCSLLYSFPHLSPRLSFSSTLAGSPPLPNSPQDQPFFLQKI